MHQVTDAPFGMLVHGIVFNDETLIPYNRYPLLLRNLVPLWSRHEYCLFIS